MGEGKEDFKYNCRIQVTGEWLTLDALVGENKEWIELHLNRTSPEELESKIREFAKKVYEKPL